MKAVIIREYGGRDKLIYADIDTPVPGSGEALIKINAAGVNPVDAKIREGFLKERMPNILPITLGWDLAGTIVEPAAGSQKFRSGDEVFAYARTSVIQKGTYAEYLALPETSIAIKPPRLSFEEAAGVPLSSLTAYQSLFDNGHLVKNQDVLIIGASGGVGSFAVQLAGIAGGRVYAVASGRRKEYLRRLGAHRVIDYTAGDFKTQMRKLLPGGADLVFDCAGGEATTAAYSCVKPGGTLVSILSPQPDENLVRKFRLHYKYVFVEARGDQLDIIRNWFDEGNLTVSLQNVYPLAEATRAHEQIETRHTQGKLVLRIS